MPYLDDWTEYLRVVEQLAPSTIAQRRRVVIGCAHLVSKGARAWDPGAMTRADVEAYCRRLAYSGRKADSIRVAVGALRAWGRYLMGHGVLSANPAAGVRSPKIYREEIRVLTVAEVKALIGERSLPADDPVEVRNRVQWAVAYAGALRVSELCGLMADGDLEWDQDVRSFTLVIRHAKGARTHRRVPLPVTVSRLLAVYLREVRPLLTDQPSPWVFPAAGPGACQTRQQVYDQLARRVKAAGIEPKGRRLSPHQLRHARATHLIDAGHSERYVGELLGHRSPQSTRIYTHVTQAKLQRMVLRKDPLEAGDKRAAAPQVGRTMRALLEDLGAIGGGSRGAP